MVFQEKNNSTDKKQSTRAQESSQKKKLIYDKAMRLFSTYGYANTTIADISRATGMSTGSIYHYYRNKEAILMELSIYMSQVEKLQTNIEKRAQDPYDTIFSHLLNYAKNWEDLGVNLTKHVYSIFDRAYMSPDHTLKKLVAHKQLTNFISVAQRLGKFDNSIPAEKASENLLTFCRGIIFEWTLFEGSFSLTERSREMLPRYLKTFIQE